MGMHWKIPRKIGLNHTNNFNFACKAIIANWILAIENDCIIEHENADLIVDAKLVSKANDACLNLLSWVSSGYHTLMMNNQELVDRVYAAALDTLTDKNTISEEAASALYLILQEMSFDKKTKTYKKTSGTQITVDA
uniref:DUF2513 domain-containing protein n=1 Tax=Rhabditophanes sp. KR3021 TaxID=114890 RepID=A0AC35UAA2_9BILA